MHVDLVVLGGGSGGFGAALAAARRGLKVCVVEGHSALGGTSTLGGVNTWEPGIGGPGFHGELFEKLARQRNAVGLSRTTQFWSRAKPYGLSRIQKGLAYRDSLRRSGIPKDRLVRVTFEPQALDAAMRELLARTGNVRLRLGASMQAVETARDAVRAVRVRRGGGSERIAGAFFVDATGSLALAGKAGCRTYLGAEPRSLYGEPCAPPAHQDTLNGVSLCFRVSGRAEAPCIEREGGETRACTFSITEYPNGDLNFNPLPLMQGWEFQALPADRAFAECERRARAAWRYMQREQAFGGYRLTRLFPVCGVREGPRLVGRDVLTETDVRAGCGGQRTAERWITLADHDLDVHGEHGMQRTLKGPYGVPYDCLLPREYRNLAVACRGASFSHIAAASCRLSRTMMQLGQAAGVAAACAWASGTGLPDVDVAKVRETLRRDGVALDPDDARFPPPAPA